MRPWMNKINIYSISFAFGREFGVSIDRTHKFGSGFSGGFR